MTVYEPLEIDHTVFAELLLNTLGTVTLEDVRKEVSLTNYVDIVHGGGVGCPVGETILKVWRLVDPFDTRTDTEILEAVNYVREQDEPAYFLGKLHS
jgi:hypothetical protein